ncbi:hypothetical protein QBC35DRAFT_477375 [Podospora australis]|uniref:Uncharacterized protein n=1 Tax=Podospora australis TaxID=1536484 RepID=A0AAN6WLH5_9PEZI|nr:hypothetical protein QBC35DRAFT_477375 [Podospora australis]
MHPLFQVAAGALLVARAAAQGDNTVQNGVLFIYPTKNQIYNKQDIVNVTYTSPFPTPNLYTFCSQENGGVKQIYQTPAPGFNGSLPVRLNFTSGLPCWFNLRPGTQLGFGANSVPITIIGVERASGSQVFGPNNPTPELGSGPSRSTTGDGTTSATSSASTSAPTDAAAATGTSVDSSSSSSSSSDKPGATGGGLGGGQSAGIVIGAIVGVLLIAGGLFWWWRRRRTAKKQALQLHNDYHGAHDQPHEHHGSPSTVPPSYYTGQHEAENMKGPSYHVHNHPALDGAQDVHYNSGHHYKYATELSATRVAAEIGSSESTPRPKYEMPA